MRRHGPRDRGLEIAPSFAFVAEWCRFAQSGRAIDGLAGVVRTLLVLLPVRRVAADPARWARFGAIAAVGANGSAGCYASVPRDVIWVHAVSAGEAATAAPLIRELTAKLPDVRVLVTTVNPTAASQVRRLLGNRVSHCYAPYDFPWALRRFLNRVDRAARAVPDGAVAEPGAYERRAAHSGRLDQRAFVGTIGAPFSARWRVHTRHAAAFDVGRRAVSGRRAAFCRTRCGACGRRRGGRRQLRRGDARRLRRTRRRLEGSLGDGGPAGLDRGRDATSTKTKSCSTRTVCC